MKIGVFDSGYGGLTVLARCLQAVEAEKVSPTFVYYADCDYAPYGERTVEEVQQLTQRAIDFLIEKEQVELVVIACNTATSLAIEPLRARYPIPLIGIEPAIKPASAHHEAGEKILVTATPLMIESERLNRRIKELALEDRVERLALPGLVRIAEDNTLTWEEKQKRGEAYLEEQIPEELSRTCGAVVLGCTHFPIFLSAYQKVFKERGIEKVYFADGAEGVARTMLRYIPKELFKEAGESLAPIRFYQSGRQAKGELLNEFQTLLAQIQQQFKLKE